MKSQGSDNLGLPSGKIKKRLGIALVAFGVIGICVTVRYYWGAETASANPPRRTAPATTAAPKPQPAEETDGIPGIVGAVNNESITREELGEECLRQFGEQVLERVINKFLIEQECQRQGITITKKDVWAEVDRMSSRFGLPKDQWLKMLEQERGITGEQYADDIIWPTLALRRLAGAKLTVTQDELRKAYESKYGDAVFARLISCSSPATAQKVREMAAADPDQFGNLAKEYSQDVNSAAAKGLIQPIRRHGSFREIEQAAFTMADGEVSPVIQAGGQYVILKRERLLKNSHPVSFEEVAPKLEELIRDSKLRTAADDIFRQLQENSRVVNIMNDPRLRQQKPGVAAMINGRPITIRDLADHCIERHGEEVLEGAIGRRIIEQECRRRRVVVTEAEIDAEIARLASLMVQPRADGKPDVNAWLKLVRENQGVSPEVYRRNTVWPSLALKKLVGDNVQISEEDLQKAFDANYGEKVRCRAIVLDNHRRALEVWEKVREKLDSAQPEQVVQFFGQMAAEYSIEPASRALRGEVPPIRRNGGQSILEKEAFELLPGELSGVIPVGADRYAILLCEGRTTPVKVAFDQVRGLLYEDLFEKKQRIAMAKLFRALQDASTVDNYLTGTSKPAKKANSQEQVSQVYGSTPSPRR